MVGTFLSDDEMEKDIQTLQVIVGQALDLISAFIDFLWTSSVSLPVLIFVGVTIVAFLLGLLLGGISKHGDEEAFEDSREKGADRVVLDLERLTPLGLSAQEEEETQAMDISGLRPDELTDRSVRSDQRDQLRRGAAPERQ